MTDLIHTNLVRRLNQRAEMQEMSRLIMPLLYAVAAIVALSLLWIATEDYRDVAAHRAETVSIRVENSIISSKLVACAKGEVVSFDGGTLLCKFKRIRLVPL